MFLSGLPLVRSSFVTWEIRSAHSLDSESSSQTTEHCAPAQRRESSAHNNRPPRRRSPQQRFHALCPARDGIFGHLQPFLPVKSRLHSNDMWQVADTP